MSCYETSPCVLTALLVLSLSLHTSTSLLVYATLTCQLGNFSDTLVVQAAYCYFPSYVCMIARDFLWHCSET